MSSTAFIAAPRHGILEAFGGGTANAYTGAGKTTAVTIIKKANPVKKSMIIALGLLAATASQAWAGPCEDGLSKIDAALQSDQVSPELKTQARDMRNQAAELCGAGNEAEGADVIAEAVALLGIE
jgi:hypothetical protein